MDILVKVTNGSDNTVDVDKVIPFTVTVEDEEEQLRDLKSVLGTQGTLRPIFESQLKQKRLVRERAMNLRRTIAEAGLDYEALEVALKDGSLRKKLEPTEAPSEDIDEIVKLIGDHFSISDIKVEKETEAVKSEN